VASADTFTAPATADADSAQASAGAPVGGSSGAAPGAADAPGAIATLRAGDAIDGVYACTRKDRLTARTGTPYLALELRDRSGALQARLFRDADVHGARFERGDLVRVRGRVASFRGELQAELTEIASAPGGDADPAAFLPATFRDVGELDGFLEHLAGEVRQPGFRALLASVLGDEQLRSALRRWPATQRAHHAYLGGLLEHTVAVATLAVETCALHPRLDQDLLLTAAIVHDLGRTRELALRAEIGLSDEGRMLGHVELGLRMLDEHAGRAGLDEARRLALAHCVLTHHGPDPAPGRRFALPEALALQRLNALDAGVKAALEHGMGLDVTPPA
jgi:3'-5' exoribonuclease